MNSSAAPPTGSASYRLGILRAGFFRLRHHRWRDACARQKFAQYLDRRAVQRIAVMRPMQNVLVAIELDAQARAGKRFDFGAEVVQQAHSWWVMRDPAGLLFCIIPERPGTLNDSNAQRWD